MFGRTLAKKMTNCDIQDSAKLVIGTQKEELNFRVCEQEYSTNYSVQNHVKKTLFGTATFCEDPGARTAAVAIRRPQKIRTLPREEKGATLVTMVELVERMDIMFQQEQSDYKTVDYLAPEFQKKLASICSDVNLPEGVVSSKSSDASTSLSSSSSSGINDVWREKICEWSYQVIDHFDFSREVVSISIHYLDRFLATRHCNKKVFQLAAMTSLFLAIKLYEPGKLSMESMIELSRGYFHVEQMVAMEMQILR